jgi:Peptidase propeptide and YPEB domain
MKPTLPLALSIAVFGLLAPAPVVAQTMGTQPHGLGTQAPAPMAAPRVPAAQAHLPHTKGNTPTSQRASAALNLLEAHGYGDFTDFQPDGQNFTAMVATTNGQRAKVVINPDTGDVSSSP